MPRRREVPKRVILPDPLYHNEEVAKFINVLMLSGKKAVAERILYGAFEIIRSKSGSHRSLQHRTEQFPPDGRGQEPSCGWCQLSGAG